MNAKKAKALRRVMKNLAAQNPDRVLADVAYTEDQSRRKTITVQDMDKDGQLVEKVIPISAGTVSVNPSSKRGLYNHLKKSLAEQEKKNG